MGGKFKPQKSEVQIHYENVYPKVQADPDNLRPDTWSSTVQSKNTCHRPRYMSVSSRFHPSNHPVTQSRLSVKAVTPACLIAIRHFNTYSTTTPHSTITSHWGVRCAGQAARITSLVYDLGFLSLIQRLVRRVRTPLKLISSYVPNIMFVLYCNSSALRYTQM
jgi:hypothetical protein